MFGRLTISFVLFLALPQAGLAQTVREDVQAHLPGLMETYRDLHANPELSFEETRTARFLAMAAREAGFTVTDGVGKTGVVAVLRNGTGPTVMIRTDMDALPVTEATGLAFASKKTAVSPAGVESGVMHACGHDTHMTAWIETARLLASRRTEWSGTLVMIAQPAEEIGMGALAMLKDGLFERFPKPDYVIAFHNSADLPAGTIGTASGFAMANVDSVDIEVHGVGGHGAAPHTTVDPIVIASAIVMRLQTLVSRELDPVDPAVVTVGSFHAGSKHNVIPDTARLQLTVRSYSDATRTALLEGIRRIAKAEALASGVEQDKLPVVNVKEDYTRAVYNSPELTAKLTSVFREAFGEQRVRSISPAMVGEDFGQYRLHDPEAIQSLLFRVGGVAPETWRKAQSGGLALPSLHSARYAAQAEAVIATAAEALTVAAMRLMPEQ